MQQKKCILYFNSFNVKKKNFNRNTAQACVKWVFLNQCKGFALHLILIYLKISDTIFE